MIILADGSMDGWMSFKDLPYLNYGCKEKEYTPSKILLHI
jgi:hypothetical protein